MSFFSLKFLIFFAFIFFIFYEVPSKYRAVVLFIASAIFYFSFSPLYLVVLEIITLLVYFGGIVLDDFIHKNKKSGAGLVLFLEVLLIIGALCVFKFWEVINSVITSMLSNSHGGGSESFIMLVAPVGLSFYTLEAVGYLIDIYRGKNSAERNIIYVATFLAYFPKVVSGPIERGSRFISQLRGDIQFSEEAVKRGLLWMLEGYFCKLLVANRVALIVDDAFINVEDRTGATLLIAIVLYGIELYADFAGYSLIAVGCSKCFGIDIMNNFNKPYFSKTIKEFWARWHISLSSWLKDYIYISLGGNRKGKIRQNINLVITFLVSGLWHGNGFKFIFWGLLHGFYQIIGRIIKPIQDKIGRTALGRTLQAIGCFVLVDFGWLFFRASSLSEAIVVLKRILFNLEIKNTLLTGLWLGGYKPWRFIVLALEVGILFLLDYIHEKNISIMALLDNKKGFIRWGMYLLVVCILLTGILYDYGLDARSFIYASF